MVYGYGNTLIARKVALTARGQYATALYNRKKKSPHGVWGSCDKGTATKTL